LREFDAVIVIWSDLSLEHDDRTAIIATEALRLGRLIQTKAPGLSPEQLPPPFSGQRLLAVSDTKGIAEAIAALGVVPGPKTLGPKRDRRRPGVGASDGTPYRVDPLPRATEPSLASRAPSSSATKALEIEAGRLVHKIPSQMWLGQQEVVEVRLGRLATPDLSKGLEGRGALTVEDIPIVETMSVSLYGSPGAFTIERQSETSQLVMSDLVKGTPLETQDFGRWVWLVTPRQTGTHQLYVKVSAALKDSRGLATTTKLPDKEFKVSVSVHTGKATVAAVKRTVPALVVAALGGLVAAVSRDIWWPKLYAILKAHGWLS
jgi:hypothetical protein